MFNRIIEIADDRRHLLKSRGFLVVKQSGEGDFELGQIPLDDISAVIANAHGLTYTNNLLVALAERGTPFVLCGANHNVAGMLWSVDGNHQQAKRFDAQISAKRPLNKQLWASIVKSKLRQQAAVLEAAGVNASPVTALVKKVRSGDPTNIEAQAARRYWPLLFGEDFRRDRNRSGINSQLNYGYTVLRAMVARAVVAAGLHPTIGIHHSNQRNSMRLVDDLMESYRPLVDSAVWELAIAGEERVTPETKRAIVESLYRDMETEDGRSPIGDCIQKTATSLALVYVEEGKGLSLPMPMLPIELSIRRVQ